MCMLHRLSCDSGVGLFGIMSHSESVSLKPSFCLNRQCLFESLRMLPHSPGVQMQATPEDTAHKDSDNEDEKEPNKRISSKNRSVAAERSKQYMNV